MRLSRKPLITKSRIARRVREMGAAITADLAGKELVLLPVLKGAAIFAADLARCIELPLTFEFVRARSYTGTQSSGRVEFSLMPGPELAGKWVLVVEDILDTGRTMAALRACLDKQHVEGVSLCGFLDKPSRREVLSQADYVGFTIDDHFVVGYGLDYQEHYRHLPEVYILEPEQRRP